MNEHLVKDIYLRALEMNRNAFTDGEYAIANHALLLAVQCGQRLRDVECLIEVARLAGKESRYIHDHHPEYVSSNEAPSPRGHVDIFQMTGLQARSIIHRIETESAKVRLDRHLSSRTDRLA